MSATADTAQVMVRPPLMWALAAVIGIVRHPMTAMSTH